MKSIILNSGSCLLKFPMTEIGTATMSQKYRYFDKTDRVRKLSK